MEKSPPEAAWGSSLSWLIIRLVFIVRGKKKENALLGIVLLFPPSWFSQFKSSQLSNSSFKEGCMNPQWRWACARREGCLTLYLARPSDKGQAHLHLLAGSFLDTKCLDRASGSQREILYTHKLICKKCLQQAGPFRTTTSLKNVANATKRSYIYLRSSLAGYLPSSSLRISLPTVNVLN